MLPFVRTVRMDDVDALAALALLTGGGMTNLPPNRDALAEKVTWSGRSIAAEVTAQDNHFYMLVLEDPSAGAVLGTCSLYSRLGAHWPFYSYKISRVAHVSRDLDRSFSTDVLHLVNDFDGASEVGGLFLHPDARSGGFGQLLARSRYLFIAQHRQRFGARVVADLRGWTEEGASPFWEAVGQPFFGSDFLTADLHNAMHGNQFIADLMPRYPIYASMLPAAAQAVIGKPHPGSLPAKAMLEKEGFVFDGYVDIFDAGPTLHIRTDEIRTIRESSLAENGARVVDAGAYLLSASGVGDEFEVVMLPR